MDLCDRPGTAGSGVAGGLIDVADAIHGTLSELGVGPAVVIGRSLGGAVAKLLARDHPEDVGALILLDPTPPREFKLARRVKRTASVKPSLWNCQASAGLCRDCCVRRPAAWSADMT